MRTTPFLPFLPLALYTLLAAGCSSGNMIVDTTVTLQPGASAEITTTGDPATIRLIRAADTRASADTTVVVLSGGGITKDSSGKWTARTNASLPAGGTLLQESGTASRRVVIVNSGNNIADVKIHVTGGDGFTLVQMPANSGMSK